MELTLTNPKYFIESRFNRYRLKSGFLQIQFLQKFQHLKLDVLKGEFLTSGITMKEKAFYN